MRVRNVWRPQLFRAGAALMHPLRNCVKHVSAALPVLQIFRAADRKVPAFGSFPRGEDIVGRAVLRDGRVMRERIIAFQMEGVRLLRLLCQTGAGGKGQG